MSERRRIALVLSLAIAAYLVCLRAYYVGFFNDDAYYVIGARSIMHGRYAELNAPGMPPLVNFLPGYSLLLAPVAAVAGGALWPYQLLSVALMAAGVFFAWLYFDEAPPEARSAAALAAAFCPLCLSMSGTVLSDVPLLALFGAAYLLAREVWQRREVAPWLGLSALCGFASLVRPTGFVLSAALVAALCLEGRWRNAAMAAALGAALPGAFLLRNRLLTGRSLMYFVEAADPAARGALGRVLLRNAAFYPKFLFVTTLFRWPAGGRFLEAFTIGLCVLAIACAVREEESWEWRKLVQLSLLAFIAVHLPWSKQAGRYVLPLVPFAAGYVMWGLALLAREYGGGAGACWWAAALSVALSLSPALKIARASLHGGGEPARPPAETFDWLRAHARPADVVASEMAGRVFLYTGLKTVQLKRLSQARWAVLLPNDAVMRTASGGTPFDPADLADVERRLSRDPRWRRAFASHRDGSLVFESAAPR